MPRPAAEVLCAMVRDVAFSKHRRMVSWICASVWASIAASVHNKLNVLQLGFRIPVYCIPPNNPFESENEHDTTRFPGIYIYYYYIFRQTQRLKQTSWLAMTCQQAAVASSRTTNLDCRSTARAIATICLCPTDRFCPWKTNTGAVSAVSRIKKMVLSEDGGCLKYIVWYVLMETTYIIDHWILCFVSQTLRYS